jgi:DNA-binding MarR family transcriptional regulator
VPSAPKPLGDADYAALAELRHRLRRFLAFSEAQARRAGLTPQQHQLLLAVRAAPEPPSIGELADQLVLRHHSTVELVDRLAGKALVRRIASPHDRRRACVELTARGAEVLRKLTVAHAAELRREGPALAAALAAASRRTASSRAKPARKGDRR